MKKQKIILASASPRRHELAKQMGLDFEIAPVRFEKKVSQSVPPGQAAMDIACEKARQAAKKCRKGIVIGIDTFVSFDGKRFGKPKTKKEAFKMLKNFSGKQVKVYSGLAFIDCKSKRELTDYEVSKVKFKKLSDHVINNYVETGEPLDKAGSFAVQGLGKGLIEKIEGDYSNIVGFPVSKVYKNLKKMKTIISLA